MADAQHPQKNEPHCSASGSLDLVCCKCFKLITDAFTVAFVNVSALNLVRAQGAPLAHCSTGRSGCDAQARAGMEDGSGESTPAASAGCRDRLSSPEAQQRVSVRPGCGCPSSSTPRGTAGTPPAAPLLRAFCLGSGQPHLRVPSLPRMYADALAAQATVAQAAGSAHASAPVPPSLHQRLHRLVLAAAAPH